MAEYLNSAFRSFIDNRNASNGLPLAQSTTRVVQTVPLPFDPFPIPQPISSPHSSLHLTHPPSVFESAHLAQKRFRHSSVPTVLIPERSAPLPLISPVSILSASIPTFPSTRQATPVFSGPLATLHQHSQTANLQPTVTTVNTHVDPSCPPSIPLPLYTAAYSPEEESRPGSDGRFYSNPQQTSVKQTDKTSDAHWIVSETAVPQASSSDPSTDGVILPETNEVYSCSQCDSKFHNRQLMAKHVKITHLRPYMCSLANCSASFSKQNHLSRHIRIVHNKERPFACTEPGCGIRFGSKSHLGDHTRAVHMRLRNFKCHMCDASWSKRFNLQKHIRIRHHGEKPFKCSICKMSFGTRSHVVRHQQKVHQKGDSSQVQKG